MKSMSTFLIIFGGLAFILGIAGVVAPEAKAPAVEKEPAPPCPKANDLRIVQELDGTYSVETYCDYPAWQRTAPNKLTLEQASRLIELFRSPPAKVVVPLVAPKS